MNELLLTYFAYAYEKSNRPELAVVVEAITKMSSTPVKYTAVEDSCGWRIVISPAAGYVTLLHSVGGLVRTELLVDDFKGIRAA